MDVETLTLAKQYTDSERLAYEEGGMKTLTFDGDETGKVSFPGEGTGQTGNFIRVSETIDTSKIQGFEVVTKRSGLGTTIETYTRDRMLFFEDAIMSGVGVEITNATRFFIIVMHQDMDTGDGTITPAGTYVWSASNDSGHMYVSSITYDDSVIHPIDPKFIPAMDSITINGADGKQYRLAVDENGALAATAIE